MKGLAKVSKATKNAQQGDRMTWVTLFYSFESDEVYTTSGSGRHYVTDLIRPQTGRDIQEAVERWKRL